jgi:hypothetical protein
MLLHTALVICREAKTDDQLKEIMSSQPWAPQMIHGFRNVTRPWDDLNEWRQQCSYSLPDSIYVEGGLGMSGDKTWLDCWFDEPTPIFLSRPSEDPINDPKWKALKVWWRATVELVLVWITTDCHCYRIYYGQIEDEYEPGEPEQAWEKLILANYNYDPEVVAEFAAT